SLEMKDEMIRVSEAEAATNFLSLLERVRAGAEVIIEGTSEEIAVLRRADLGPGRRLSDSIAIAEAHAKKLGYTPTLDADFASDLEEITSGHRQPLNPPTWD